MLIPYSTDAPIYHFPYMTIGLIVANCVTFALTGMGANSEGWLLQYGNGLHPLEWVAYNFLHFGIGHLLGNMFFLWAFGIVVEGKLGWWKFLGLYMSIGIVGGFLIQLTTLNYKPAFDLNDFSVEHSRRTYSWLEPTPLYAQDDAGGMAAPENDVDPVGNFPVGEMHDDGEPMTPDEIAAERDADAALIKLLANRFRPGAGGASLVVFALLGIVLVWAPKNEVSCLWIGLNAGTFDMEYVYFCGFKIGVEVLGAVFGAQGYEITSEIAHALGAVLGFGVGAAFVKLNWVDCENWDLFAYAQNKHGSMEHVGSWQDAAAIAIRRDKKIVASAQDDDEPRLRANRKKRALPKLKELKSLDDDVPDDNDVGEDTFEFSGEQEPPPKRSTSRAKEIEPAPSLATPVKTEISNSSKAVSTKSSSTTTKLTELVNDTTAVGKIRSALKESRLSDALAEVRRQRSADPDFELPKEELRGLADGFFKQQNVRDSRPFLEEFIKRFPDDADRQRVRLAVLNVKFLKRPTAALKLLAKVDLNSLPIEFQPFHREAARQAQQMISDGIVDAS